MTGEKFFETFGEIDPAYVSAVDRILERAEENTVPFPRRKLIKTILIAAALVGLLSATAYAAGLFGLQARLMSVPAPTEESAAPAEASGVFRQYISLSGVNGSREYRAAAEWLAFKADYARQMAAEQTAKGEADYAWRDLERSFAPDAKTREICRLYQVWDAAMWEKLQEIAEKYDLNLHTGRSLILGDEFQTRNHGQYEDGSFLATVYAYPQGKACIYDFYLERDGSLPADDLVTACTDTFEEWEYQTSSGDSVSIAMRDTSKDEYNVSKLILIFYNGDGVTMTVKSSRWHSAENEAIDDKAFAEYLADTIDFEAVAAAKTPEESLAILKGETP